MAIAGNSYTITLKQTHLEWGSHRYTNSRQTIYGEGYIPIPAHVSRNFNIYNGNAPTIGLGFNIFNCTSSDGFFHGLLKSGGCSAKGNIYAKQFHGDGDLRALGDWFHHCNAQIDDTVEVRWISPTNIVITHIPA